MDLIRVVLVNNSPSMLFGLQQTLEEAGLKVVGQAVTGNRAREITAAVKPDVLLLSFEMSDMVAPDLLQSLCPRGSNKRRKKPAFALFGPDNRPGYILRSFDAGAISYISNKASPEEIVHGVQSTACGKRYLSAQASHCYSHSKLSLKLYRLTKQEMKGLLLVSCGYDYNCIAKILSITEQSVKNLVSKITKKLEVNSRCDATTNALLSGLVSLTEIEREKERLKEITLSFE